MELVTDLTLVFLAALAGGFLAQRLGQPLIVGYIVAGVAVGPFTAGPTVGNVHDLEQLAELGVILLLFSLGLEVSIKELAPVRRVALLGGTIQIVLTIALGLGLGIALGLGWQQSLWFGALISLSSTMVALKTIQSQGRLGTLSSRVMLGILVVQDLAVVPLMIVLPELSDPSGGLTKVVWAAGRAILLLGVIVVLSTRVVPRVLAFVARFNSRELFLLATTTIAVGIGMVAWQFGLSVALGAFIAGLIVNESDYAHQALSDVVPLRDLFGMLFFVSVGMLLDPRLLWQQIGTLTLVVIVVVIGKAVLLAMIVRAFGYWNVVPWAVGLTLFQVGEFTFVLARVGRSSGAISDNIYALALNTAIVTMVLTPPLSGLVPTIYRRLRSTRPAEPHEAINLPTGGLNNHVIIAGAGRVGRGIADALSQLSLPFVMVELDDRRVQQAKRTQLPVIFGDASQQIVLEAAGVHRARAMLVTVPSFPDVRNIVTAGRQLQPDLPVIARADGHEAVQALYALGIQEVASPEFEAAIEMTRQALMYLSIPAQTVLQVASAIRRAQYGQGDDPRQSGMALISHLGEVARHLDFVWVGVPADSPIAARTLGELRPRSTTGASVVGIIRDGGLVANPDGEERLEAGDLVAVLGARDQIARFREMLRVKAH
jgi:CPA2 family monovalent cation:H+ antiporter-2